MKKIILSIICFFILLSFSCGMGEKRGILGIEVPVGDGKVSSETPYLISGVYEGTPAHKAGLQPGDKIIQINEMIISNGMKFDYIFKNYLTGKPGTRVVLNVTRGDRNMVFEIIRAEVVEK